MRVPNGAASSHYLHKRDDHASSPLAERLIEALGSDSSICTIQFLSTKCVRRLATALPEWAETLARIDVRLYDLLPVVRSNCYNQGICGLCTFKNVLPVLVLGMGYEDREVVNGQTDSARYASALGSADQQKRQRVFADLCANCGRDTLAMVRLREADALLKPINILNTGE